MTASMKSKQMALLLHEFELMSKTALLQLQIVTKLIQDNTVESLYEEAEANEIIMDRVEIKLREEVVFTIFQFTPKAADLRRIISYQDITTNLERVGDTLLNVIHFMKETNLSDTAFTDFKKMIQKMLGYVDEMLRNAIFAFSNDDSELAYQILKEDDKVDELFHKIKISLQESFDNKLLNKSDIEHILNISAISHNLERVGDSATNIAEAVIYQTEGKDIRHGNK